MASVEGLATFACDSAEVTPERLVAAHSARRLARSAILRGVHGMHAQLLFLSVSNWFF